MRPLVRNLLERGGYRVLMADNADHANTVFDQHADAIDILITDVILPGVTGPALFQRLSRIRPSLKVLYMSGYTDDAIAHGGTWSPTSRSCRSHSRRPR